MQPSTDIKKKEKICASYVFFNQVLVLTWIDLVAVPPTTCDFVTDTYDV